MQQCVRPPAGMSDNRSIASEVSRHHRHDVCLLNHSPDFWLEPDLLALEGLSICRSPDSVQGPAGGSVCSRARRLCGALSVQPRRLARTRDPYVPNPTRGATRGTVYL